MSQDEPERGTYDREMFESLHENAVAYAEEAIRLYEDGYTYDPSVDLYDRFKSATSSFAVYADLFAKEGIPLPADLLAVREFLVPMRLLNLLSAGGTIEDDDYSQITDTKGWLEQLDTALEQRGFPVPVNRTSLAVAAAELQTSEYFNLLSKDQQRAYLDIFKELHSSLCEYSYQQYKIMKQES